MRQPLSDDTRRMICRLAFVLLCVVPTTAVIYRICHPTTPSQWRQLIQAHLNIDVQISRVETPTPSITVLRDVTIYDEQQHAIVKLSNIRIESGAARRITIDEPLTLTAEGLASLVRQIPTAIQRTSSDRGIWKIEFRQVNIDDGPPEAVRDHRAFSPLALQIRNEEHQSICMWRGRLVGHASPGPPMEVLFKRVRDGESWRESLKLSTGGDALPMWLIAPLIADARSLGDRCHFQGEVSAERAPRGWHGQLMGEFTFLDLERLGNRSGLELGGSGRFLVHRCDFVNSQIAALDASLESQFGWLGKSTWSGLTQLIDHRLPVPPVEKLAYSTLHCRIRYGEGFVEISQFDVSDRQQAMMVGGQGGYCYTTIDQLARSLWPNDTQTTALTDAMVEFLHRFQLPSSTRTADHMGSNPWR